MPPCFPRLQLSFPIERIRGNSACPNKHSGGNAFTILQLYKIPCCASYLRLQSNLYTSFLKFFLAKSSEIGAQFRHEAIARLYDQSADFFRRHLRVMLQRSS